MQTLAFDIHIKAPASTVWQVLWSDTTYRRWTSAFCEGSYAVSDWQLGSRVHFMTPDGNGMYADIAELIPNERMAFRHLGEILNAQEQAFDTTHSNWESALEAYTLQETDGHTHLSVSVDTLSEYSGAFETMFPKALALVKDLAENPVELTVSATVKAPLDKVWHCWTAPEHIMQWNSASDDWHTPYATNDLRPGGSFLSRMAAKDGSFSFDFTGIYDAVIPHECITYRMADGRKATVLFESNDEGVYITELFIAEGIHSFDMQVAGWQAILNHFKRYTEQQ
jgi:uncharacterized protein YndB with AHSA1/START domain